MSSEWHTVTLQHPCSICRRPNPQHNSRWCRYTTDGRYAWCPHSPGNGNGKDCCVYRLDAAHANNEPPPKRQPQRCLVVDWPVLNTAFRRGCAPIEAERLAARLGVTYDSLVRLQIGRCNRQVWTFPMSDGNGEMIGIRTRDEDGLKRAVYGSRNGLFMPTDLVCQGMLLVCEGPTDTAAMLSLGFNAIGRADCGHTRYTEVACRGRNVVIVADPDEVGRHGADNLRRHLIKWNIPASVIVPPAKDARAWLNAGAVRADVLALVGDAP